MVIQPIFAFARRLLKRANLFYFVMDHLDVRHRDSISDGGRPSNIESLLQSLSFLGSAT